MSHSIHMFSIQIDTTLNRPSLPELRKVRVSVSTNFEVVSFVVFEILTKSFQKIKVSGLES